MTGANVFFMAASVMKKKSFMAVTTSVNVERLGKHHWQRKKSIGLMTEINVKKILVCFNDKEKKVYGIDDKHECYKTFGKYHRQRKNL